MLLYKSDIENDTLIMDKKQQKENPLYVSFTTRDGSPLSTEKNYIPFSNSSKELVVCKNPNKITIGINFVGARRNVKIIKGFSTLEVFGGSFYISENVVRIVGNFDKKKYSLEVPLLSLVVEELSQNEHGDFNKYTINFYYSEEEDGNKILINKKEFLRSTVFKSGHIVNITFYKEGHDTIYIVPSQRIISDLKTKNTVINRIGRSESPNLLNNIFIAKDADEALNIISKYHLKNKEVVLIAEGYGRNDLFGG